MSEIKKFEGAIASYGYPVNGVILSREAAEILATQLPGRVVDNVFGIGYAKQWRVLSARIEEREEGKGVVIASCEVI
jgi:hypothetical protein